MLQFTRCLSFGSFLKYGLWRLSGKRQSVVLSLRDGGRFELRGSGAHRLKDQRTDYGVAWEVFAANVYAKATKLPKEDVRLIVDIGANVGMSLVLWLTKYPNARIIAFEPHPVHRSQIRRNVSLNCGNDRVETVEAGAGSSNRKIFLSDCGAGSTATASAEGIETRVEDIFTRLQGTHIDLLKIDAEGAQYELLADPRMASLDFSTMVIEWHHVSDLCGRTQCIQYLRDIECDVIELERHDDHGILWVTKRRCA
jgi:FkbM family methyltransferase